MDYQWTVQSALYQLRWEPSERRASAVKYLREIIDSGNGSRAAREVAAGLLELYGDDGWATAEDDNEEDDEPQDPFDPTTDDGTVFHDGLVLPSYGD